MSAPRFTAGTLVEVIAAVDRFRALLGRRFVLEGEPEYDDGSFQGWVWRAPKEWATEFGLDPTRVWIAEHALRPIAPDREAEKLVSWAECPWRPNPAIVEELTDPPSIRSYQKETL